MQKDWKYEVEVLELPRAMRVPKEVVESLGPGFSKSTIRKLKRQAVDCPVLQKRVSFVVCYQCPNFVRRVRGIVYCRGEALPEA